MEDITDVDYKHAKKVRKDLKKNGLIPQFICSK